MYMKVMADIRAHLAAGTFDAFRRDFARNYVPTQKILDDRKQAETGGDTPHNESRSES
jgi:hypothetical protein